MLDAPETTRVLRDSHGWFGIVFSILAFAIFFAGTVAFYKPSIQTWEEPAQRQAHAPSSDETHAWMNKELARRAEQGAYWVGWNLPSECHPLATGVVNTPKHGEQHLRANVAKDDVEERESFIGQFIYQLHFFAMVPRGYLISGVTGLVLFLLAITGILVQGTRFVRDLWSYRPNLSPSNRWLDLHRLTGGMALPFILLFAWTGSAMCLVASQMRPMTVDVVFDGDRSQYSEGHGYHWANSPSGEKAAPPAVEDIVTSAEAYFKEELTITNLQAQAAGDTNALYGIRGEFTNSGDEFSYRVGPDLELFDASGKQASTTYEKFLDPLYSLHIARWAGDLIRFCLVFLGFACVAAVWIGNRLWIERRVREGKHRRAAALWRLTVGGCAGLIAAFGVMFAGNRLIPADFPERAVFESNLFFGAWGLFFLLSLVFRQTHQILILLWTLAGATLILAVGADLALFGLGSFDSAPWRDVQFVRTLLFGGGIWCIYLAQRTAHELQRSNS